MDRQLVTCYAWYIWQFHFFGHFQLELQACSDNTGHISGGLSDDFKDDGMKRAPQSTKNSWSGSVSTTHQPFHKPQTNPEQTTQSLFNISVSLQRK